MSQDVYDHHQGFIDEAQKLVDTAKEDKNQAAADKVADKITSLPDGNPLENGDALVEAQEAYENLTDVQKGLVSNEDKNTLDSAVQQYITLSKGSAQGAVDKVTSEKNIEKKQKIVNNAQNNLDTAKQLGMSQDVYDHHQGFIDEAQKLVDTAKEDKNQAAADKVADKITGLPDGNPLENGDALVDAQEAYENLTDAQKDLVSEEDTNTLDSAVDTYISLSKSSASGVVKKITNEKNIEKKQKIVNNAQDNLDTAKELGMSEDAYDHNQGFIDEAQKLVDTAKENSTEAKYNANGSVENIPDNVAYTDGKFTVPKGVESFEFTDKGRTVTANYKDGKWIFSQDGFDQTPANSYFTATSSTDLDAENVTVDYGEDKSVKFSVATETKDNEANEMTFTFDNVDGDSFDTSNLDGEFEFNANEETYTAVKEDDGWTVYTEEQIAAQDLQAAKDTVSGTDFSNLEIKGETAGNKKSAVEGVIEGLDLAEGVTAEVNEDGSNVTLSTDGAEDVTVETGAKFHLTQAAGTLKTLKQKIVEYENKDQFANIEIQDEQDSTKESAVAGVIDHLVAGNGATNSVSKTGENTYEFTLTADNADDVTVTVEASFDLTQAAQDLQAAKDTVSGTDFSNLEIKGETAGNKKSAVEGVIEGLDLAEGVTAEVNEDGSNVTLSTDGAEDVTVETGAKFHLTQAAGTLKTLKQKIVEYENKDQFANIEIQDEQDSTKESAVAGVIDHLVAGNGATNSVSKTGENTYEFALTADNADDVTVTINASFKVIK
ncbi:hypothetical protein GCM10008983_11840 [Lentibacillus halophilus]|uniref:Uncharacterized protein n=1 Tax=Lentibacillus halophilus TaxID=295065 RepID=A0ABP3J168_9BACI